MRWWSIWGWLAFAAGGLVLIALVVPPIRQPEGYHAFADQRTLIAGIPNTLNVLSNLPFLVIGILGTVLCSLIDTFNLSAPGGALSPEVLGWVTFYFGINAVAFGSAYYHLRPNDARLIWDRLPMTVSFTSILVVFIIERVSERGGAWALAPAVGAGIGSVLWWEAFDDLRWYLLVQFVPLVAIPVMAVGLPAKYSHSSYWLWGAGWYVLAKLAEFYDVKIFRLTRFLVSGHTLKHLLAALVPVCTLLMKWRRVMAMDRRSLLERWGLTRSADRRLRRASEESSGLRDPLDPEA